VSHSVAPGRVLGGRYRLDQEIAHGGMATVWRGEDPLLARTIAVKTLDPQLAADDALRVRFRREAIAAAAVAHPNIVATYDTGEDDGVAYIVMELVEGATLRQAIDLHGALPPARAADIGAQVADALAAAHSRGLIHRDVKPSNVLVQLDGRVKVTDFGIAKAADQSADELTRTGNVLGTARYLAPEQVEGHPVDERSDVYSLGLVLYEMLAGRAPFGADTELATAVARLTSAPPRIIDVRPDIAPGLAHVVDRALARDPDDRWPTAAAMRDALTPFRVAAPDRGVDATMPVAMPTRTRTAPVVTHPEIISDDGIGVGARVVAWIVALALGIGGGYAGFVLANEKDSKGTSPPVVAGTRALDIVSVHAFDPDGDQRENDQDVSLATDGQVATAWTTEGYFNPTTAPKHGVGLILEIGAPARIATVDITSPDRGWDAQIYVASESATTLAGWGSVRATGTNLGTTAQLRIGAKPPGQFVLVWLTKLPRAATSPDGQPRYVGRIAEVSVRGSSI
jgi:serine/threonine-protein kinase